MPYTDIYPVHTSDRILYKRCRRKWDLRSSIRKHLEPTDTAPNIHLWLGTGVHFALEDYHGYNRFGDPVEAIQAYYLSFKPEELPIGAEDSIALAMDIFEYYKKWLHNRREFETIWIDGVPQVEVQFELELVEVSRLSDRPVIYRGTIDRVAEDVYGDWWVQDYKTAARIDTNKLANDVQTTTYIWAAEQIYERPIIGMIYTQFAKDSPQPPKSLVSGGLSVNKQQKTSHRLYRDALLEFYPDGKFPSKYVEFLGYLAEMESPEGDRFIRSDKVYRNQHAKEAAYRHIINEATEMVNPDLPIYPNPTRDCVWDCSEFRTVCIAMDEGDDWEYMLEEFYREQSEEGKEWQRRIKYP